MMILFFIGLAHSFILTDPDYRLKNPEEVKVYISDEGCGAAGLSDGEFGDLIKTAIKDYWNTVPESRLKMKFAGTINISVNNDATKKGIIHIGCGNLGPNTAGSTSNNPPFGSSRIVLKTGFVGNATNHGIVKLLAHEMGHSVGLGHSKDKASIMTYEEIDWSRLKYLSKDDKDGVVYLYPKNEAQLAGLVPSCESFAGDAEEAKPSLSFFWSLILGFSLLAVWRWKKLK